MQMMGKIIPIMKLGSSFDFTIIAKLLGALSGKSRAKFETFLM